MSEFCGKVSSGLGNASRNLKAGIVETAVAKLLCARRVEAGTLNIELSVEFKAIDDENYNLYLEPEDYNKREYVKIKKCKINGYPSVIVRPADHFNVEKFKRRIEIMSSVNLREHLDLSEGEVVRIQCQGDDAWWNGEGSAKPSTACH